CIKHDCVKVYTSGGIDLISQRIAALRLGLDFLYSELRNHAPNAAILVVGYPRILGERSRWFLGCFGLTSEERDWLVEKGNDLNTVISEETEKADAAMSGDEPITFVDTADAFAKREACTGRGALVNREKPFHGVYSFHPNGRGQMALEARVWRTLA